MIHGTLDSAVRIEDARNLAIWQPKAKWIELPSDHVFGRKHPRLDSHLPRSTEEAIQHCIYFLRGHVISE